MDCEVVLRLLAGTLLYGGQSVMDCQQQSILLGPRLAICLIRNIGISSANLGGHANDRLGGYEVELAATCRASCRRRMSA